MYCLLCFVWFKSFKVCFICTFISQVSLGGGYTEIQSQESDNDGTVSTLSVDSTEDSVEEARDASTASAAMDGVPKLKRAVEQSTVSLSLKGYQMIVNSVFHEQLDRDNIVKVLRSRFSVKANTLTTLTVSQLTEIIAKKLLNYQFCSIKKGASSSNMKM